MAKGDPARTDLSRTAETNTGNLNTQLGSNSRQLWDNYNAAAGTANTDYNSIMNAYRSFGNPIGNPNSMGGPVTTGQSPQLGNAPSDDNTVNAFLNAHGITDPEGQKYWRDSINSKADGLQAGNEKYWSDFIARGLAQNAGGALSGGSGGGINWNPQAYSGYQNFANGGGSIGWDPEFRGALSSALGGYGSFAQNGGFSPQDIQDIRARAISPTRSVYSSAQSNINRARSLQGFSPNYTAATAKMTRDLSSQISDANVNANASIAQMVQQGKLAGLQGLSSTGQGGQGLDSAMSEFNRNLQLSGLQGMTGIDEFGANLGLQQNAQELQRLAGMSSLYSATPGLASMFGNQALQGQGQQLQGQGLQNQLAMGTPGFPWAQTINAIGSGVGTAADVYSKYKAAQGVGGPAATTGVPGGTGATFAELGASGSIPMATGVGAGGSLAGGGVLPGAYTGSLVGGGAPASAAIAAPAGSVGSGSSAGAALSGGGSSGGGSAAGALATNPMLLYAGGNLALDWLMGPNSPFYPKNGPPPDPYTIQADQTTAQGLLAQYGPDSPLYNQFLSQHPWAG